jgi:hypothetical protein
MKEFRDRERYFESVARFGTIERKKEDGVEEVARGRFFCHRRLERKIEVLLICGTCYTQGSS